MLEPGQRRLFLDALRPPEGYTFDRAVGTTFTLDLMALLAVPLAFTFRDAQDGDGQLASDPLALLESARGTLIASYCFAMAVRRTCRGRANLHWPSSSNR